MPLSYDNLVWVTEALWVVVGLMLLVGVWALDKLLDTEPLDSLDRRIAELERIDAYDEASLALKRRCYTYFDVHPHERDALIGPIRGKIITPEHMRVLLGAYLAKGLT